MSIIEREHAVEVPAVTTREVTTRDLFHRAADLIEEFGHVKHDVGGKNRGFCAIGAWHEAGRDLGADTHNEDVVWSGQRALRVAGLRDWLDLLTYNNAGRTTAREIVAKLREAAESA